MTRKRRSSHTTWHYDLHGRLRARTGPEGTTRWTWDGQRLVGVTPNRPSTTIPATPIDSTQGVSYELRY